MTVIDAELRFSSAQTFTADAQSTNVYDLAVAGKILAGEDTYLVIQFSVTPTFATSLRIDLRSAATTDLTSSPRVHWSSGVVLAADYAECGFTLSTAAAPVRPIVIAVPRGFYNPNAGTVDTGPYLQYLGMYYDVTGAGTTTLSTFITKDIDMRTYHASGYTPPNVGVDWPTS